MENRVVIRFYEGGLLVKFEGEYKGELMVEGGMLYGIEQFMGIEFDIKRQEEEDMKVQVNLIK